MSRPLFNSSNVGGASTTSLTVAVTVASVANRVAYAFVANRAGGSSSDRVTGVTCGGNAMTKIGTTIANAGNGSHFSVWRYIAPATGSVDFVASLDSTFQTRMIVMVLDNANQTTPNGTVVQNSTMSTGAITLTDDDILLTFAGNEDFGAPLGYTPTGTATQTEYHDGNQSAEDTVASLTPTTGSVTGSFTYGGTLSGGIFGIPVAAVAAGPTINTQPVAGFVILNETEFATKTLTTAATASAGARAYTLQEETAVASAVYADVATGGIYGSATAGDVASISSTLTPTNTAKNGLRYRHKVTDSNGTTYSTAVLFNVYTGAVVTTQPGVTNASGAFSGGVITPATVALSTFAGQNGGETGGWFQRVLNTVDGTALAVTSFQSAVGRLAESGASRLAESGARRLAQ